MLHTTISYAQADLSQRHIKTKTIEGYIFPKDYIPSLIYFNDAKERYNPSKEDVLQAEQIIKDQLLNESQLLVNHSGNFAIIHKNLARYKRQYVGYIDQNGDKIIWINFITEKEKYQLPRISKDVIVVLDGSRNYWNIKVNINKDQLSDLRIDMGKPNTMRPAVTAAPVVSQETGLPPY